MNYFFELPRLKKNIILACVDGILFALALLVAFWLRYNTIPEVALFNIWIFAFASVCGVIGFILLSIYQTVIRYSSMPLLVRLFFACGLAAVLLASLIFMTRTTSIARSLPIIWALVSFLFCGGFRYAIRGLFSQLMMPNDAANVIIYGAGNTGFSLAKAIANTSEYKPIAFIDHNASLEGKIIQGVRVHHPKKLSKLIEKTGCEHILLAIPSLSKSERKLILDSLKQHPVRIKTIPALSKIVSGLTLADLPDVEIEDLLGRAPVEPLNDLLSKNVTDKVVLVTGAGGSIGSEICRQVYQLAPKALILLDHSEYALYTIHHELGLLALDVELIPVIGDVKNRYLLEDVFETNSIDTVYHAAAYKHVPMVEANIVDGVINNALGTYYCALQAVNFDVETFILISTDKAVRPPNVMGASKRLAEILLQNLANEIAQGTKHESSKTIISMVRFGNVLGSSGSVVPLFKKQIKDGGPVTVTHPEMTRYFMTIPEATQLVIQAGAMAEGGDVFLLEMGEPVKIAELAHNMIHLMGYEIKSDNKPNGDIAIKYVGIRPGEKLFEELLVSENSQPTIHPQIMKGIEEYNEDAVPRWFEEIEASVTSRDSQAILAVLNEAVDGFTREFS